MSELGAAIVVGVGAIVVSLLTCGVLKRKRAVVKAVGLLGERDAPLMDALDQLLIRRELVPIPARGLAARVE